MPGKPTFAEALRALVDEHYPGHTGAACIVRMGAVDQRTRVPPAPVRFSDRGGLDEQDRDILQAAHEAGRKLTAEELADAAGYEPSGRFRERLARLVRQGHLVNRRPGYSYPDAPEE